MLFVISTLVQVVATARLVAILGLQRLHLWVLAASLVMYTEVTVAGRLLSIVGLLGNRAAWVSIDLVFYVAVIVIWHRAGRPRATPPKPHAVAELLGGRYLAAAVIAATLFVAGLYMWLLVATVSIPQNVDDVLTAYLARVGYWIQHGSVSSFPTSAYNSVQVSYPANPQFPLVRSIVLFGNDRLVGLEQWAAAVFSGIGVYGLSLSLGARSTAAFSAGLAWLMMPTVVVGSGLALTDLVAVNVVLMVFVFGYRGWMEQRWSMLILASVAFGMSIGTKQTSLFLVPSLVVLALAALALNRELRATWARWMLMSAPIVGLLGMIDYVRNYFYFGHPLGDPSSFELFAVDASNRERFGAIGRNLRRLTVDSFGTDLPPRVARRVPGIWILQTYDPHVGTGIDLLYGTAWAGPFCAFFIVVGTLLAIDQAVRRGRLVSLIVLLPAVSFILIFLWTRPNFSLAFSRYALIPEALLLAVAAVGVSAIGVSYAPGKVLGGFAALMLSVGAGSLAVYIVSSSGPRPLSGSQSAWGLSRTALLPNSLGFADGSDIAATLDYVNSCTTGKGRIGLMVPGKFPQSLLFGADYRRPVKQYADPFPARVSESLFRADDLELVILDTNTIQTGRIDASLAVRTFGSYDVVTLTRQPGGQCG